MVQWYAPNDVKGSQLNNVIINSLPITTKTLNLKVNGTNVNKVERGTTVQLCASCNTNGADVTFSILKKGETTPITLTKPSYAGGKYTKDYSFDTIGEYTIYFTATKDGYSVQSAEKKLTVTKATIPASAITAPAANALTYNGNEQALITAGSVTDYGTMQYSLTKNGTYSPNIPTGTDAGAYTVWYRVIGDANHNDTAPASVAVSIRKKPLTITGVTAASKPYDGTTNAGITSVTFDGVTLNLGTDYNVAASFDEASVGNGKNVTATVTLIGQAAQNYALEQSSFPTTGSITKAAAPDFTKETSLAIINGYEKTYTVTLPALPTLETPKEYGAPTYELGEIKLNDGYYTDGAKVENGKMTLPIQKNDVGTTGPVGTVTVVIKSKNYEDITLTVTRTMYDTVTVPAEEDTGGGEEFRNAIWPLYTTGSSAKLWNGRFEAPSAGAVAMEYGVTQMVDGQRSGQATGLTYAAADGETVTAPQAGNVVFAGTLTLTGGTVVIDHGCGVKSYLYGLETVGVERGQSVSAGDPLGTAGTAHNLIYELRIGSKSTDPQTALDGNSGLQFREAE